MIQSCKLWRLLIFLKTLKAFLGKEVVHQVSTFVHLEPWRRYLDNHSEKLRQEKRVNLLEAGEISVP